jgi:PEGA domain
MQPKTTREQAALDAAPETSTDHDSPLETRRWLEQFLPAYTPKAPDDAEEQSARVAAADFDPLLAFSSEQEPSAPSRVDSTNPRTHEGLSKKLKSLRLVSIAVGAVVVVGVGVLQIVRVRAAQQQTAAAQPGKVTITSRPAGAEVTIDGRLEGRTPLALAVNAGTHSMMIRLDGHERVVPLSVAPGSELAQYLELPVGDSRATASGRISIVTDPLGAPVTVDGRPYGVSPVTVENLSASEHRVSVSSEAGAVYRSVTVQPGATASVVFSLPKVSPAVGGWLALETPFDVQLLERGEVVGATGITKIMLPAGRHDLLVVNGSLGYQESRRIDVAAEKVTLLRVVAPKVALSVNARPWADISIDGNGIGQTPIANFLVPIGAHQVVFRHPQLGERRQSIVVTTNGPNRAAVDLTK